MDTNQQMDRMLCERVLTLYSEIEAALGRGAGGYAREKLRELRSLLQGETQPSAFSRAHASLPAVRTNPYEWKSDLARSRSYIEVYLDQLQRSS